MKQLTFWLKLVVVLVSTISLSFNVIADNEEVLQPSVNIIKKELTLSHVVDSLIIDSSYAKKTNSLTVVKSTLSNAPKLDNLIADYQKLTSITNDKDIRDKVDYRLAQLLTLRSENRQELGIKLDVNEQGYYDDAINAYKLWLKTYSTSTLISNVLYQLAKAYELQGERELSYKTITDLTQQFPTTKYLKELHFRRGEYLFSKQQYVLASKAYQSVFNSESNVLDLSSPFYQPALYMAGWSQYKLNNAKQSLAYFSQLLDLNLPTKANHNLNIDELPIANKQLVVDAFKVMNIIFSNNEGPISLANFYKSIGGRYFEYLHYDSMAQEFLINKRYRDSAQTYDIFVNNYPTHILSPTFSINKVNIFEQGRFPTLAKTEKEKYIEKYGIYGPYWLTWSKERQQNFSPILRSYLSEIAIDQYRIAQKSNDKKHKVILFKQAASLLLEYKRTFNDNAQLAFLYAESLYASGQWREAINTFNDFAYGTTQTFHRGRNQQANAAYAALLAFDDLFPNNIMPKPVLNKAGVYVFSEHEQNAIMFTQQFPEDKRSVNILLNLMNHRFSQARYIDAIHTGDRLLAWPIAISESQIIDTKLIKAHSTYNQGKYQLAIIAYQDVIQLLSKTDERLTVINNNFAASLFNFAEILAADNKLKEAVNYYQKILDKTPNSPVVKLAHFNGAQYLYKLNDFDAAIKHLLTFKSKYAHDELASNIDVQLASIYEQQKDWNKAASQHLAIANKMKKSVAQQQALYLTASYYEKAQDEKNALIIYRRHANTYMQPVSRYLEVMNKITEKYLVIDEQRKYRFWLNKIIKVNDQLGKKATARSTYLAAKASLLFANDAKKEFDSIKLRLPLRASLALKKKSLANTLTAYKKVLDYNVAEFSTQSTFETAQVYRQLASDLIDSQRPKGLSDLALEQYEILLEEQAFPYEDQAIVLYENNAKLSWQGFFDKWIEQSFERLSTLLPGRYNKVEEIDENVNIIY